MVPVCAKAAIEKIKPHMLDASDDGLPPVEVPLHANDSAFGPSPKVKIAARASVDRINNYMERADRLLASAIGERFGLDPEKIAVGPGSDEILARLARAYLDRGAELVRSRNGYLKVPNYAYANDAVAISVPDEEFKPSVDALLAAVGANTRMVYVANPENPAGALLSSSDLRRLQAGLPGNVLLVVDSAYEEYVSSPEYEPPHGLVEEFDNVVVCRTFSKIFGLAGARVGWMYAPIDIASTIRRIGLTFPLSTPSAVAALEALKDRGHTDFVFSENLRLRKWLSRELESLGIRAYPSQGNFILAEFTNPASNAREVALYLRRRGIAVRRFASPSYERCIRITIGLESSLRVAVEAISEYVNECEN
ncbi:MAG: histidinol-phosphate transaminase [Albidovulum sp.]|nr:histidinol-phosphate transaminase [Albidovulum sp.]MDE0306104.1 histidinol-phosphate transaminase [Albidovulum sp.]MDE0531812.1 histidinol-phosphate transaminase [Albidovulum sp.]